MSMHFHLATFPRLLAHVVAFHVLSEFAPASVDEFPTADPELLELEIRVRDTNLLAGEMLQYEVILRNGGSEPIPLAVPSEKMGLAWIAGSQLFLEPIWEEEPNLELIASHSQEYYTRPLPARVEEAPWPPVDVYNDDPPERIEWLPAGYELAVPGSRVNDTVFVMQTGLRPGGLKASWLTGPARWVESEVVSLSISDWDRHNDMKVAFEQTWIQQGIAERTVRIARIHTSGSDFLFSRVGGLIRLGEISADEIFEVEIHEEIPQMVVSFPESDRNSVYFHLDEGAIGMNPFGQGGYAYFTPEPRPIPPEELRALRERLGLSETGERIGLLTSLDNRARAWLPGAASDSNGGSTGLSWWLWVAGGALLSAICLVVARFVNPGRR